MSEDQQRRPRTLVVGAGTTGSMVIDLMQHGAAEVPGIPVVVVDDDPAKQGTVLHGVAVAGGAEDIADLAGRFGIEQVLLAVPSATPEQRARMYDLCAPAGAKVYTVPAAFLGTDVTSVRRAPVVELDISELLSRPEVVLNTALVSSYVAGRTVLVTGGGGSIGSELCRQLAAASPARVVVFDIYENTAYELLRELQEAYPSSGTEFVVEVGSVRDGERLDGLFTEYSPEVVFHAAAHKHVPLMERNPREAVLNNVGGTLAVARRAHESGAERFVFVSTDKAVNPTSVMGATKRVGEMVVRRYAASSQTVFSAVRFGNVLGSHGSVVPLFRRQIARGGPVTVTHRDITRYFMTIPEAARLIVQAGGMARGGEVFVLDMGDPVRIYDLAERMVRLSGLEPGVDVEIQITGLRPGEKLYEELLMDSERTLPTANPDVTVSAGEAVDPGEIDAAVARLMGAAHAEDPDGIKRILAEVVPTYRPKGLSL